MRTIKLWGELLGKNPEEFDYCLTFQKLCKTLSGFETLKNLEAPLQTSGGCGCIPWLNKLFHLLLSQSKKPLFEEYAIIPNQNGIFKKKTTTLYLDGGIDETIKDIAKASGEDWRDCLVHRAILLDNSLLATKKTRRGTLFNAYFSQATVRKGSSRFSDPEAAHRHLCLVS
ncbi:MAG: hypothetical protein ACREBU_05340 [Nitrososphaera sp.]